MTGRHSRWAIFVLLPLTGCVQYPEPYIPPMQRKPFTGPDTSRIKHFVSMNDPDALDHIVRDVNEALEGNAWRWTGQRPTLRFVLPSTKHVLFTADFSFSSETMAVTGPVTISYIVNGRLLDKVRYDTPGAKHFEKPVDSSWLKANADTVVTMELDKAWTPEPGVKLGVTLTRAGFLD